MMRVAVLILGLILGAIMLFQATLITALSGVSDDSVTGSAGDDCEAQRLAT